MSNLRETQLNEKLASLIHLIEPEAKCDLEVIDRNGGRIDILVTVAGKKIAIESKISSQDLEDAIQQAKSRAGVNHAVALAYSEDGQVDNLAATSNLIWVDAYAKSPQEVRGTVRKFVGWLPQP